MIRLAVFIGALVVLSACNSRGRSSGDNGGPVTSEADNSNFVPTQIGGGNNTPGCFDQPGVDDDLDGYVDGDDCNDCDPNANPGALDTIGNNVDEDCNGMADDTDFQCDSDIVDLADTDAVNAAKAIGLCKMAVGEDDWGLIDARYVKADGTLGMNPDSAGLLPNFGTNVMPREGTRLLALSSGTARNPSDPGYKPVNGANMGTTGTAPPGFPVDFPACNITTANDKTANDPAALEITVRVPTNANSVKFNLNFYTYEFPNFVCSQFNDFFVALQNPPPPNAQQGNVSFDSMGNSVSVNNGFLEVCAPQSAGGKNFTCPQGQDSLAGTGYDFSAATGWLETVTPVTPGSVVTFRFAIWDMGDHILDSTVLIDGFEFSAEEAEEAETVIVL